jgi:hypothetical protein
MPSYAVLLKPGFDGIVIDGMLDVSAAVFPDFHEQVTVAKVWDRMHGTQLEQAALHKLAAPHADLMRTVWVMTLRRRFDGACDGPFLLHCESELTLDELQALLRANPEYVQRLRTHGRFCS